MDVDNYEILLQDLFQRASQTRQPVSGSFELTNRCNMSCRMCYVQLPASDKIARQKELSPHEWINLTKQAVDNGLIFLLLTGGEVFLRKDFFEIYEPLSRLGILITLFTNGTLISEEKAIRLAQNPPNKIEITLYGATQITYESVTGVRGSYSRCRDGIERLLKQNFNLGLKTTITRQNVGELQAMKVLADELGLPFSADWLLSSRRDNKTSDINAYRLSAEESISLEVQNLATANHWIETLQRGEETKTSENFYCLAGKSSFAITPYGDMIVCLDLNQPAINALDVCFKVAWEKTQQYVDFYSELSGECSECTVQEFCQRCPAWSYLETNTLTSPIPYLCEIANTRNKKYQRKFRAT